MKKCMAFIHQKNCSVHDLHARSRVSTITKAKMVKVGENRKIIDAVLSMFLFYSR